MLSRRDTLRLLLAQTLQAKPEDEFAHFTDIAATAGLTEPIIYGGIASKKYILETNGCGVAFIDYDNDGWIDIFLGGGSRLEGHPNSTSLRLYKNNRNGTFTDVTRKAGLERVAWVAGVCVGDYNNDGFDDLFLSCWGQNILYRNNGNGTFTDVTDQAGLRALKGRWSAGCTWLDYDRDGLLDLFISEYLEFDLKTAPLPGMAENCSWKGIAVNCGPKGLPTGRNRLYRNLGNGKFTDVSEESGIGKTRNRYGMTAVAADFDNDGWPDIFVACDSTASVLYRNRHDGTFEDLALQNGVAYNEDGREQAGMGVAVGDVRNRGNLDLFKTHFADDTPVMYLNDGKGFFEDVTTTAGLGAFNRYVGWGAGFADFDNDGWLDLLYVNGNVYPEIEKHFEQYKHANPRILLRNRGGGKFEDASATSGPGVAARHSSRGCALGDFDNNGRIGALIMNMNEPPSLLRNTLKSANHWLKLKLIGTKSNRSAIGASAIVTVGSRRQRQDVLSQSSFYSQNDLRLHFGLGSATLADQVELHWPSGLKEVYKNIKGDQILNLVEGGGTAVRTATVRERASKATLHAAALLALSIVAQAQTYSEQIAPILNEQCVECHRAGESAPFPLTTYEDARKHASQMVKVTRSRYMPPWPPASGYGDFAGARRLSEKQITAIGQWAASGTPLGDPAKAPPPKLYPEGWRLGPPDLVVKVPVAYTLEGASGDVFRNFVVPVNLVQSRYVRAVEIHPGDPKAVHHANIVVDRTRSLRSRDGLDGQPGFPGMDVETESGGEDFEPDSHFLFWKPGAIAQPEPPDMAWRLDPTTDLIVNLHLQPSGKPERIQPEIGLYFTDRAPTRFPMLVQLEHDGAIDVAPGTRASVTDELTLPAAAQLLAIYPHAHYIGRRIEAWATLPSGKRIELIRISDWDINWQASYTYRKPIDLPANTRVAMRVAFDNSAENPRNPSHPPKRVHAGNRSEDEMGHVWLQLLPAKDDRLTLHLAIMRRRLQKYPADFLAHYNLGAALQSLGQHQESIQCLGKALKMRPDSVAARNTLGVGFMLTDQFDRAAREFREVLRREPNYANARFNLARTLAGQGDSAGAIAGFEAFLRIEPNDARAHNLLAGIYASTGQIPLAIPHFRRAADLNSADADTWTNLGAAMAMAGDYSGAITAFEAALRIDSSHAGAKANLARAKADRLRR